MALQVVRTVRGTWHLVCTLCGGHADVQDAAEARQWEEDHNAGNVRNLQGEIISSGVPVLNESGEEVGRQPRHPSTTGKASVVEPATDTTVADMASSSRAN